MTKARDIASAAPAPSTVDATELGYLDGVSSAIQTQLDAKTAKSTLSTTGDIYYASSANTPARLGIGSTDQVLKVSGGVPAWATPAAGGGMTLLSTTALSGSSVTISSIDQTYKNLFIFINNVYNSTNCELRLRVNGDTASNYRYGYLQLYQGTAGAYTGSAAHLDITNCRTTSTDNVYAQITIPRYAETELHAIYGSGRGQDTSSIFHWTFDHTYTSTTAISSITILPSVGTMSGGTVYIYGVK